MKLHLPSSLRKALLTCLAALTSLLPATLASGAFLSSGAFCSLALAEDAVFISADDEDDDENLFGISPIAGGYDIAPFSNPTWTDPEVFPSEGQYTGIGNATDLDTVEGTLLTLTIGGGTRTLNNGTGKNLKIIKEGPNSATTLNGSIQVDNLWLTGNTPDWGTGNNNRYEFGANALTSSIQNIYINKVGVKIATAQTGLQANFCIGEGAIPNESEKGYSGLDLSTACLQVEAANSVLETSGYLEVRQDAGRVIRWNTTLFKVSELRGSGDLTISSGGNTSAMQNGKGLALTNGGSNYQGRLIFVGNSNAATMNVYIGDDLNVTGLAGEHNAQILALDSATPTLSISGNDVANSATGITIGNTVTLSLKENAQQTFLNSTIGGNVTLGNNSKLTLTGTYTLSGTLSGDGTLSVMNGTLSNLTMGSNIKLEVNITNSTKLDLSTFHGLESYNIGLSLSDAALEVGQYTLVDNWVESWNDKIHLEKTQYGRKTISFSSGIITITGDAFDITRNGGNFTWTDGGEGWIDDSTQEAEHFYGGDRVTFNGDSEVTLSGNIAAGNMTVASGDIVLHVEEGASLTVNEDLNIQQGKLVIDSSRAGVYSLGNVTLAEGTEFRVKVTAANTPFVAGSTTVSGDGALVFEVGIANDGLWSTIMNSFAASSEKLHEIRFTKAEGVGFTQFWNAPRAAFAHVENLVIGAGMAFSIQNDNNNALRYGDNRLQNEDGTPMVSTIHLNGDADENTRTVLHTTDGTTVQWDVTLDSSASMGANNTTTLTISGAFRQNEGALLTIGTVANSGGGTVQLQNVEQAGDVLIRRGALQYNFSGLAGTDALEKQAAKVVDVNGNTVQFTGTTAGVTYGVDYLKGAGTVSRNGDAGTAIVKVSNELTTSEDAFTGTVDAGLSVDMADGYWKFGGTMNGALSVSGGTLEVSTASLAGSGSVTMAGGAMTWTDSLTVSGTFGIASGSTFEVAEGLHLTANTLASANGGLSVASGATVTLRGGAADAPVALSSLTLQASGSRAELSGAWSIASLNAAGGSVIHIGLTGTTAPATVISGLEEVVRNGADKIVISMDADEVKSFVNAHAAEGAIVYSLFTDWNPTWNDLFDLDIGELGGVEASLDDEGNITFAIVVKDLLWNGGVEGVWTQDGEGWKLESGRGESFATYDNVTFAPTTGVTQEVHISGTVSTSLMTIKGEGWNFQDNGDTADKLDADRGGLVMSDGSSATFSGALQISASAVKLGSNATLTLSNTGAKALGAVTLGAMSRLVVTTAEGWNGTDTSLLSGTTGTLELRGLNLDNDHATARNAIINNLIPRWDAATGVTVGSIELTEGTDLVFGGTDDKSPRLKSVGHIYVKSGSSIDVDNPTMNVGSGDIPVLHLEGTGVDGKGAFSHLVGTNRTVTWGLKLDEDATFAVKKGTNVTGYIQYVGTYNGDRHTLTKTNTGELQFAGNFNTAERSEGAFDIQEGNINLTFTANAATALANYSFHMGDAGTLDLSGNTTYVVNAISGTGEVAASAARTLQVNNSLTAAGTENSFAGSLSNVRLEVTGGYQAVTAALPGGTVMGASGTGTLAVSGSVQGELTLELGNGGTLDMAGAKKADGAAVTYTQLTGAGTIRNLTLSGADVVGFAEATGLSGSRITLDRATLSGGTLAFGVVAAEPEDESDGAWSMGQGVSYITYGSPVTYRGSEKTTLAIDPYGRMEESGDIRVLKRGTYLLIENFGAAADLTHYTKAPTPLGRMSYTYRVADGNLYLDVVEAAGQLTWDVAQGGDWNTPNAWIFNGFTHASFRDGDVVTFTTLEEESGETVIGPVKVSIAPGETVSVGGITVTGETSYVLDGDITGIKDAEGNDIPGVKDAGLVVGTLGAEGKSFMGTLTLTGENSWLGDNVLNSGNVVVTNARALSTGITTVGSAAMLQIECGGELASTLNMQGGLLKTMEDVTVNARITSGSFSAAEDTTLTIHREGGGSGRVLVNSDGSTGRVYMALDEPSAASTALTIGGGALTLSTGASSEATYTVTGAITLSGEDTALVVEEGVTLSGNVIAPQGTVTMEGGSALSVSGSGGSVGTLISHGSSLQGSSAGAGTKVGTFIADADTTLSGMWEIRSFSHEGGVLTIAGGVTGITPEYDTTTGRIVVQGGAALRGGSEEAQLTIQELELSGDEGAVAALAAGSNIDTPSLSVTNGVIAAGAEVTLSSAAAKAAISGSGSVLSGVVHVLGGAQVSITDGAAMDGEIDVTNGSVSVESDAVGGTAFLSGPRAKLDFNGSAASTVVTMCSGAQLLGTGSFTGTIIVEDTNVAAGPGVYDLGGLGTGASVRLNGLRSVSSVTGLTDALNLVGDSALALGTAQRDRQNALIRFDGEGATGAYKLADGATLTVNITSILSDIMQAGSAGSTYYVFNKGISGTDWTAESVTFDADLFLYKIDVSFEEMNGSLTFSYSGPLGGVDIFYSSEEGTAGSSATLLSDYAATDRFAGVVMDRETIIDLSGKHMDADHPDGLVLRNLAMTEDGSLSVKGSNNDARPEPTLVTIRNTVKDADLEQYAEDHGLDIQNIFTVRGDVSVQDAHLKLSHIASDGTLLTGSRTRMMGDLSIAGGQLIIESGELELNKHADVEEVVFTRGTSGQLIVSGCTASVGNISLDAMEDDGAHTEHIRLENEGVLEIRTGSMVATGISIGNADEELGGTVNIEGKSLVSAGASLQHVVLHLKDNSRLTITPAVQPRALSLAEPAESSWELAGLTGGGELSAAESRNVSIRVVGEDRTYSGNLASYHGTMTIGASDYSQIFSGVLGGDGWSLTNSAGGRVTLDLMGARARNSVVMDDLTLQSGSHTQITLDMLNLTPGVTGLNLNTLYIANGANVTFAQYGEGMITLEGDDDAVQRIVLGSLTVAGDSYIGEDVLWELSGVRNYKKGSLKGGKDANGDIYLEFQLDNTNRYAKYADGENATAGANMLWGVQNATGELGALDTALSELLHLSGEGEPSAAEKAQANRVLAAAAGASTAALGEALGADLERQLRAIRNRTTSLGYGAERNSSVWLNAESNYHKQKADELLPGYKLNGWGGTVGVHTELPSVHSTVGVALTAMYNDVESDGADRIKGDMDTYYLSAFAQVAHRAWRHTFIATVGTASVDVDRTVNYGSGSYTTSGSTDGMSFGLLYEVGYTLPLRSDYSVCLQPVLNVAWKTTTIDAYTENGGNAALNVGEQSYSTITFGAGARLQAAVGSRLWNRTGLLEGRALVKVDAGDRQGEVETAFASAPEAPHGRVKSAERGAVGVELGAGITVPTGATGSVFADFSAELRADYTNLNATLGYKINF